MQPVPPCFVLSAMFGASITASAQSLQIEPAVDCAWHGESSSTTETPAVTWEIGSADQTKFPVTLPIAVKVKLRVYQSARG